MVNSVILIGRAGKDSEIKKFDSGNAVSKFSLATSESYKKDGEWVEKTEWHNVVCYGYLAEKQVRKGSLMYVEGKIKYRSYEKDGQEKWITEIVATKMREVKSSESVEPTVAKTAQVVDDLPF